MTGRSSADKILPPRRYSLPGPDDIRRTVLPNGITILCRSNFNSPSIFLGGYIQAGSLFDPVEHLGLADFTALTLLRGTQKRDMQAIFEALESRGASFSFSSGAHTTGFSGRSLAEDMPVLLEILAEAVLYPTFPLEQVEKLRAQLLTSLAIRGQDTAEMASLTFDQIVFEDHPYRHPVDGWPETVRVISRDDLELYHRKHYGPKGMCIAVVGAVQAEKAIEQIQQVLGAWENPDQPGPFQVNPPELLNKTERRHCEIPEKSQSDIVIGVTSLRRKDPGFLSASLGNSILGQFGMMGRIGETVREKSGLAYYAYSSLNAGIGPGTWEISAGVNPNNVEKTIELIRSEVSRFVNEGVTEEELSDSQANFIGRLPLSLESNAGVAGSLLNIERFDLGLDYYHRYPELVNAVTQEQVVETARKYLLPDRLAIAVAGSQVPKKKRKR